MNFYSQISTTRKQSERLLALGVSSDTADMSMPIKDKPNPNCVTRTYNTWSSYWKNHGYVIPAWSLSRLLEMIPVFLHKNEQKGFLAISRITYPFIGYWDHVKRDYTVYYNSMDIYENVMDLIEWLIQNGYFNKEYLRN